MTVGDLEEQLSKIKDKSLKVEISVDVSTGDDDSDHRLFANPLHIQNDGSFITLISEKIGENYENRNFTIQSENLNEVMKEMLNKFNLGDLESKFFAQNPDFPSYDIIKLLIEDKYKIPYEEITPEIRRMHKDEFFMLLYSNKSEDVSYLKKLMKNGPKSNSKDD